jgi:hypothetical protein
MARKGLLAVEKEKYEQLEAEESSGVALFLDG